MKNLIIATLVASTCTAEAASRIVTYGTSLTAGGQWQSAVASALGNCSHAPPEIVNLGKAAATSKWGLANAWRVVNAQPDIVIIEFSVNDAHTRIGVPLDGAARITADMVREIRRGSPSSTIYLMTTGPVLDDQGLRPGLPRYFAQYRSLATQLGVGIIDTEPRWVHIDRKDIPDGVHPSAAAFKQALVPAVVERLTPAVCGK